VLTAVAGAVKPVKPVKHEDNKTIAPNHLRPAPPDGFIEFEGFMRVESLAQVVELARLAASLEFGMKWRQLMLSII
jgi:hypothetical protein